jgi:hypothetical protein
MEHKGVQSVVLGHTAINIGRAAVNAQACEPLILRITSPAVKLNLDDIHDAMFTIVSTRLFPKILSDRLEMLDDAFAASRRECKTEPGIQCPCHTCSAEILSEAGKNPLKTTKIIQMKGLSLVFELASGGRVPPEQVEQVLGELECMNNLFLKPLFLLPLDLLHLTRACLILLEILRIGFSLLLSSSKLY